MTENLEQQSLANPLWKEALIRFVVPIAASIVVGIGTSFASIWLLTSKLESRVDHLEVQIERHEKALDRDFLRHEQVVATLSNKTDDQERRLTRLEALVNEAQATLSEIRSDIKTLLRGSGAK